MDSSRFRFVRGVSKSASRWRAQVWHNGKNYNIGTFDEEEEAARAYDAKARELGVAEVWLNHPVGLPPREGPPPRRKVIGSNPVGTAGFRGVELKMSGRYRASFNTGTDGKKASTRHDTAEASAHAWDAMARKAGRPEAGLNFPRGGQPNAASLFAPRHRTAKRRREASAERASGGHASAEREEPSAGAEEEDDEGAGGEEAAADPAAWLAEAESASLPRLRALMQAAERRAAARGVRRAAATAAAAAARRAGADADARLAALEAEDAQEAGASARMRELISAAERAEARLARRREAEAAAREAEAAAAKAAALQAQAQALAAQLAELDGEDASDT